MVLYLIGFRIDIDHFQVDCSWRSLKRKSSIKCHCKGIKLIGNILTDILQLRELVFSWSLIFMINAGNRFFVSSFDRNLHSSSRLTKYRANFSTSGSYWTVLLVASPTKHMLNINRFRSYFWLSMPTGNPMTFNPDELLDTIKNVFFKTGLMFQLSIYTVISLPCNCGFGIR